MGTATDFAKPRAKTNREVRKGKAASKPEPSGVVLTVKDVSKIDSTVGMEFMFCPRGPVILNSPEEMDDVTGQPRGTTREMLKATGACRVSAIARIKVPD